MSMDEIADVIKNNIEFFIKEYNRVKVNSDHLESLREIILNHKDSTIPAMALWPAGKITKEDIEFFNNAIDKMKKNTVYYD